MDDQECTLEVMKCFTAGDMFGKEAAEIATIKVARAYMRTVVFEPHIVLEEMECNAASVQH